MSATIKHTYQKSVGGTIGTPSIRVELEVTTEGYSGVSQVQAAHILAEVLEQFEDALDLAFRRAMDQEAPESTRVAIERLDATWKEVYRLIGSMDLDKAIRARLADQDVGSEGV